MASDDDNFLSRWARRKQSQRQRLDEAMQDGPKAKPMRDVDAPAEDEPASARAEAERQRMVQDLPDPDTLEEHDDFSQFMQEGVPEDLRSRALRRLWRSNPVYAVRDGLNDYDLDYTDAATVVENLKTAFQVGRGMVDEETRKAEAAAEAGDTAGLPTDATDTTSLPPGAESAEPTPDAKLALDDDGTEDPDAEEAAPAKRPPRRLAVGRRDSNAGARGSDPAQAGDELAAAPRVRGQAARRRWGGSET